MPPRADPWAFHAHPLAVVVVALGVGGILWAQHRFGQDPSPGRGRRRHGLLLAGGLALLAALWWPLADLAVRWSLLALVVQRLLLTLVAAPLLLAALPAEAIAALTRPRALDRALEVLTLPPVAVAVFTLVAVGTLLPPAVAFNAQGGWHSGLLDAVLFAGGLVLWGPVLEHIPGASRPGPLGVAVYLVVQSLVPTFLALVFVFARHPLYPVYAKAGGAIGISALADQEVAGIIGKVGTLPILWTVAWRELARARRAEETGQDPRPLVWVDVQRRLERAERQERRSQRAGRRRSGTRPPRQRPGVLRRPKLIAFFPTVEPPGRQPEAPSSLGPGDTPPGEPPPGADAPDPPVQPG